MADVSIAMMRSDLRSSFGFSDAAMAPMKPSSSARVRSTATGAFGRFFLNWSSIVRAPAAPARSSHTRLKNLPPFTRPSPWSHMPGEPGKTGPLTRSRTARGTLRSSPRAKSSTVARTSLFPSSPKNRTRSPTKYSGITQP